MNSKIKELVLIHVTTHLGGGEIWILNILKAFKDRGIRIHLITQHRKDLWPEFCALTESQLVLPMVYPRRPLSWLHLPGFITRTRRFMRGVGSNAAILVGDVHTLWSTQFFANGRPVWSIWNGECNPYCAVREASKWLRYGAKKASVLLASSPTAAIIRSAELIDQPIVELNPTLDLAVWDSANYDRKALRGRYRFSSPKKLAFVCGRIQPTKGQTKLLERFLSEPDLIEDWQVVLVGPAQSPEDQAHINALLDSAPTGSLLYLGPRRDIPSLMSACDILIAPGSFHESFGLVVAQGAVMKMPIFAYEVGALPFLLGKEYPGLAKTEDGLIARWKRFPDQNWPLAEVADRVRSLVDPKKMEVVVDELLSARL